MCVHAVFSFYPSAKHASSEWSVRLSVTAADVITSDEWQRLTGACQLSLTVLRAASTFNVIELETCAIVGWHGAHVGTCIETLWHKAVTIGVFGVKTLSK